MADGISRELARFAATVELDKIPGDVQHKIKELSLDTLGCALGAPGTPEAVSALNAIAHPGGPRIAAQRWLARLW